MASKQKSTLDNWLLRSHPTSEQLEPIIPSKKRSQPISIEQPESSRHKQVSIDEVDLSSLESDPGLRRLICDYNPNQINMIRREYLDKGPFQPTQQNFPFTSFGTQNRRFNKNWFRGCDWLEYSVVKDACFCLYCYLFKGNEGDDCFVVGGFNNWKKKERLRDHVGGVGSVHNKAYIMAQNLMNQNQHIDVAFVKQNDQVRDDYKGRLETSIKVVRLLLELETSSLTLKKAIDELLSKHNLATERIRGQGYDGASNMRGEYSGLKSLFLQDNKYAFYVHCFAHQLQLTLVNVAKNSRPIMNFFDTVSSIITVVGSSCKRKDALRELQLQKISDAVQSGLLNTGRGLNQESSLKRAADTRWGSHYDSLVRIIGMFSVVVELLAIIDEDGRLRKVGLHLMKKILGITNGLSKSLQRRDQDIVNAMSLVKLCKQRFQQLRDNGWEELVDEVTKFCLDNDIDDIDMDGKFVGPKRPLRCEEATNNHHYRIGLFYVVIDMQVSELEDRFPELATELLSYMGCLSPTNSFSAFNKNNLVRLSKFYEADFSRMDILALEDELDMYHIDMLSDIRFAELTGITELSMKMVETGKQLAYPLVYSLITLVLILPVSTATVERAFSAMKIVKTELRNRMGDVWMSDSLLVYIEKKTFLSISMKKIAKRFQGLKKRRKQLPLDY